MTPDTILPGKWATYGGKRWRVGAVGMTGGERYYWLLDRTGSVAMVPGFMVGPWAKPKRSSNDT
jgi:hypothetical protein